MTTGTDERGLLEAGAVLALGADGTEGGARAELPAGVDVLEARGYTHPATDDRVVVRLVPETLGAAEDLALEYLGFASGGGEPVGRVRRQSLGFPAWALVNDPARGRHALAVVKEMERLARLAVTKPGHAKDGFDEIATRLDRSVPHFLPTYYEQVARHFLAAESASYASAFFGKAREAERRHALTVDEDRLREVFLEFAAAGALSGKTLREQARGLAERLAPEAAFEQFRTLCQERAAAGLAPYAGMLEDLRRLAKAAGRDVLAEEAALVTALLPTGAVTRAPLSFWKAARPALVEAARREPAVRVRLLRMLPAARDDKGESDLLWLAVLEETGAFALLAGEGGGPGSGEGGDPGEEAERPPTAAGWFGMWATRRQHGYWWRGPGRFEAELALVERFAAQLAREGEPVRLAAGNGRHHTDLDLLDCCLAHGVPVAEREQGTTFDLARWLDDEGPGRRDLAAIAGDARFARALRGAVERVPGDQQERLPRLAADPVLGPVIGQWLAERAADLAAARGLPALDQQLSRLARFSDPAVLATAPEAVAGIAAVDVAPTLARTLRAGILDELGWPALEETVDRLSAAPAAGAQRPKADLQLEDAWPALVVARDTHAVAVGPDGVLDERTLTRPVPQTYSWERTVIRWSDGQWLIASGRGSERRANWSGSPADTFAPAGTLDAPWRGSGTVSLPLPGGGRFYGSRPMRAGDTSFGDRRPVASDGLSYWVLHDGRWYEYDPATARRGRAAVPAFFDAALAEGGAGSRLVEPASRLLPLQPGLAGSPFGTKDGLLGWWVRYDTAQGTLTACGADGSRSRPLPAPDGPVSAGHVSGRMSGPMPVPPLRLPGSVLHPVVTGGWTDTVRFHDAEGTELGWVEAGGPGSSLYAGGTALVPPLWYWHALRPRDEAGSAALRALTDAEARALLEPLPEDLPAAEEAVRRVLPGITHPRLAAGVAVLVLEAARTVRRIAAVVRTAAAPPRPAVRKVTHAKDGVLNAALAGLVSRHRYYLRWVSRGDAATTLMDGVRTVHRLVAGTIGEDEADRPAADGGGIPGRRSDTDLSWLSLLGPGLAAVAARAALEGTPEEERQALLEFLDAVLDGPAPLTEPGGRLRTLRLTEPGATIRGDRVGEVHRTGERTLLIVAEDHDYDGKQHWRAVEYAPDARFGPWAGFTLSEEETPGGGKDPVPAPALRRLAELVRARGPVPYRAATAERFAQLTGMDVAPAALLLLGLPRLDAYGRDGIPAPEALALAGLRPTRAATARDTLRGLGLPERQRLLAALVPADPADVARLWEDGFDADALAARWIAVEGVRRAAPIELMEQANRETHITGFLGTALNPEHNRELTGRTRQRFADGALIADDPGALLTADPLVQYAAALRWLAYRLPYGDPLRAVLPDTLRALRLRLADEGLLIHPGVDWTAQGEPTAPRIREAFGLPAEGGARPDGQVPAGPALVLVPSRYGRGGEEIWLRPAAVLPGASPEGGPDHPTLTLLAGLGRRSHGLDALRALIGDDFAAIVADDGPAGAVQHPVRSAPDVVASAAERLGRSEDAAALYLMLLALPDPTDRNVAAWTGWKPARLKKARAELAATGLVVEAKRPRAGRSLFLPGGWLDRKAPGLPLETWKTALFGADAVARDAFLVPDCPVPELFRRAWRRVTDGDAPGFEEFAARRTGRGRR